jgi:hypothetical protein
VILLTSLKKKNFLKDFSKKLFEVYIQTKEEGRYCGPFLYMNRKELNINYAGILPNTSAIF